MSLYFKLVGFTISYWISYNCYKALLKKKCETVTSKNPITATMLCTVPHIFPVSIVATAPIRKTTETWANQK